MRRTLLLLAFVLGIAAPAFADDSERPRAYEQLNQRDRERELQAQEWQGPSGFWTSPHKATHGAYRYRMMAIGAVLVIGMGFFMVRLIKRANAERAARG